MVFYPKDTTLHSHHSDNLKSNINLSTSNSQTLYNSIYLIEFSENSQESVPTPILKNNITEYERICLMGAAYDRDYI
jgi:hypothetical protein